MQSVVGPVFGQNVLTADVQIDWSQQPVGKDHSRDLGGIIQQHRHTYQLMRHFMGLPFAFLLFSRQDQQQKR